MITAVTASVDYCKLIGIGMRNAVSLTITVPASMTTRVTDSDATGASYVSGDQTIGSGSSGTRTFSGFGATTTVAGVLLTIKPA